MLNQVTLMGRLTNDPELRKTQTGISVVSFSLAVDRRMSKEAEKKTDFFDITAWRGTAELIAKYFTKGKKIIVTGRLQRADWTDKDGNKRQRVEVVADNIYFPESKKDDEAAHEDVPEPEETDIEACGEDV